MRGDAVQVAPFGLLHLLIVATIKVGNILAGGLHNRHRRAEAIAPIPAHLHRAAPRQARLRAQQQGQRRRLIRQPQDMVQLYRLPSPLMMLSS